MKVIFFIISLFLPAMLVAQEYTLMWEDNFDAPQLNENYWTPIVSGKGGGNAEMQYYTPKNISIEKHSSGVNCLVLNAKKERYRLRPATSARLTTKDKVTCKYGKIEARILLPKTANGLWPAFWMMGNDLGEVNWPKCGEIDILEVGHAYGIKNNIQDRYFNGACHWGESFSKAGYPNLAMHYTADYSLQDDFHLYTLIWTPDSVLMYLDLDKYPNAKPYFEMGIAGDGSDNHASKYFHKPFFILFNLAVGGSFTGFPTRSKNPFYVPSWGDFKKITALPADGSPAKMWVDYVRIYQQGDDTEKINIKE